MIQDRANFPKWGNSGSAERKGFLVEKIQTHRKVKITREVLLEKRKNKAKRKQRQKSLDEEIQPRVSGNPVYLTFFSSCEVQVKDSVYPVSFAARYNEEG